MRQSRLARKARTQRSLATVSHDGALATPEVAEPAPALAEALHRDFGNQALGESGDPGPLAGLLRAHLDAAVAGVESPLVTARRSNRAMLTLQRALRARAGDSEGPGDLDRLAGRALPAELAARFGAAFGHDFRRVRVHTGADAADAATAIDALAFTVGRDVYFGPGAWAPGTPAGDELLAHELTHVVQFDEGRAPTARGEGTEVSHPSDPTEREAYARQEEIVDQLAAIDLAGEEAIGDHDVQGPAAADEQALGADVAQAQRDTNPGRPLADVGGTGAQGTPVGTWGRVGQVSPGLALRSEMDPQSLGKDVAEISDNPHCIELLRFNDRVFVLESFPGDWLKVRTDAGNTGYVSRLYVFQNAPDPDARLYQTVTGDTALGIAGRHYPTDQWGKDARFYTNVLVHVNQGGGDASRGIYKESAEEGWDKARVRAGTWIWIPSQAFADTLRGVVDSGSLSYEVAGDVVDGVKGVAGFVVGFSSGAFQAVAEILTDLIDLVVMVGKAIWEVIQGTFLAAIEELWEMVKSIDPQQILQGLIDKWNAPDPYERWVFRGTVIGYALMTVLIEVLVAIFTGGAGNVARMAARFGKLGKVFDLLKGLSLFKKAEKTLGTVAHNVPELQQVARALGKTEGAAEVVTDASKVARVFDYSDEVRALAKKHGMPLDEAQALNESLLKATTRTGGDHLVGEDAIARFLGVKRNDHKLPEYLVQRNDGKFLAVEVKNQNVPAIGHALEKFESVAGLMNAKGGKYQVGRFEVYVKEGFRNFDDQMYTVAKDGRLLRDGKPVVVEGTGLNVYVKERNLGPNAGGG